MSNKFARGSRYQGHIVQALPLHYVCAECEGGLIWQDNGKTEVVRCAKDTAHSGLVPKDDIFRKRYENEMARANWARDELAILATLDPAIARARKESIARRRAQLFGEEEEG